MQDVYLDTGTLPSTRHSHIVEARYKDNKKIRYFPSLASYSITKTKLQCSGSITFWYGSGSADLYGYRYLRIGEPNLDPDLTLFFIVFYF